MVGEHTEYDRDVNPYPSSGKKYNGEKAIISLTSWKARINTVPKTLFSLIKQCPGFHIVLVLSEEEFPQKEKELPEDLLLFVENDIIELLWVYKNYKSFKKVLFTMDKYRDVPIISADDDCIYKYNYAEELYQKWIEFPDKNERPITYCCQPCKYGFITGGYATLHPPFYFKEYGVSKLNNEILAGYEDDLYYASLREKMHYTKFFDIGKHIDLVAIDHDSIQPMRNIYQNKFNENLEQIYNATKL